MSACAPFEEWDRAGRELARTDPPLYRRLLAIAMGVTMARAGNLDEHVHAGLLMMASGDGSVDA